MRRVGQAVVAGQAAAINQCINRGSRATAGVLVVKGTHCSSRDRFTRYKTTQRTHRNAGVGITVIGLVRGTAAGDAQYCFVDRGAMRGVGQAVVVSQATVGAISQRIDHRCRAATGVLVIKGTDGASGDRFRTDEAGKCSDSDVCRRIAVIGLISGAAARDGQSRLVDGGTMRGISQAVVSGQAAVNAVDQAVHRCGGPAADVLGIKGAHGGGRHSFNTDKATQRTEGDIRRSIAVIGLVGSAAAGDGKDSPFDGSAVCGIGQAIVAG